MLIQCLIKRDGVTSVQYCGKRFDFAPNEHGHYVCEVANPGAVNFFMSTFGGQMYGKYVAPETKKRPLSIEPTVEGLGLREKYGAIDDKDEIESECFKDFQVNLDKRYGIENMRKRVFDLIGENE